MSNFVNIFLIPLLSLAIISCSAKDDSESSGSDIQLSDVSANLSDKLLFITTGDSSSTSSIRTIAFNLFNVLGTMSTESYQSQIKDFDDIVDIDKRHRLMKAMDAVNESYGRMTVRFAINGFERKWKLKQNRLSPCYTTRMDELIRVST